MPSYFKWEPGIDRKLQRELEQKFRNLKIKVPVETGASQNHVSQMSAPERRALLWLDEHCGANLRAFREIAAALKADMDAVADVCRRLQQRGYLEITAVFGGQQDWFVKLTDDGRIAAADIRRLPEIERQRVQEDRKKRRRKTWETVHDKYLAPMVVGIFMLAIGVLLGKYGCAPQQ